MSKEQPNEPKEAKKDLNDVEMVFGSSNPSKTALPDIHVTNERRHVREPSTVIARHPDSDAEAVPTSQTQPLLEPDRGRQKPPLAGPEVDDLDGDAKPSSTPFPGIDDGLLDTGDKQPAPDGESPDQKEANGHPVTTDEGVDTDDGNWWRGTDQPDYPYDPNTVLRFGGGDDRPGSPMMPGQIIPDVNTYQQKKNLAQGMMDLALLSANANQLRYVLESSERHPYYYPSLVFISLSIIIQIAVGVGLIMNSRYNVKDDKEMCRADKINNMTVLGIFLITIVNVFITSFSVATPSVAP